MNRVVVVLLLMFLFSSRGFCFEYSYGQPRGMDSDLEYIISKMEKKRFGRTNMNGDIYPRLDNLDIDVFGTVQDGDYSTRLNRLRHAFSASNKDIERTLPPMQSRDFRPFFRTGRPTSMPTPPEYYSNLFNDFMSW